VPIFEKEDPALEGVGEKAGNEEKVIMITTPKTQFFMRKRISLF